MDNNSRDFNHEGKVTARNVRQEEEEELDADSESSERFSREMRLNKNSCPLCTLVQKEVARGNPFPVEEWIYLAHMRNSHGIEP